MKLEKAEKVRVKSGLVLYEQLWERRRQTTMEVLGVRFRDKLRFGRRSTFPFLKLPAEIRNMIYALVLPNELRPILKEREDEARMYQQIENELIRKKRFARLRRYSETCRQPIQNFGTYPLFLVSKQVFLEAVHVFNGQVVLMVDIQNFEQVFRVSPYGRMAMAQRLILYFSAPFSQGYTFGDLMPLRMANNLRSLVFHMEPDSIRREHWDSFYTTLRILMTRFKYITPRVRKNNHPSHGSYCLFWLETNASVERDCLQIEGLEDDILQVMEREIKAKPVGIYTYDYCRPCQILKRLVFAGHIAGKCVNDKPENFHFVPHM